MKSKWILSISLSGLALLASTSLAYSQTMDQLMAGAKREGQLTVIA